MRLDKLRESPHWPYSDARIAVQRSASPGTTAICAAPAARSLTNPKCRKIVKNRLESPCGSLFLLVFFVNGYTLPYI